MRSSTPLVEIIGSLVDNKSVWIEALSARGADVGIQSEATAHSARDMNAQIEALRAFSSDSMAQTEIVSSLKTIMSDVLMPLEFSGFLPKGTTTRFIANIGSMMSRRH
jgi:hypothetical protein